ncbi:hypothetical protein HDU86_002106 [Geranomyces michiganensis]|nr:hypothetical protein HDU86_002106 [Geranomyces michiganensis]
MTAVTAKQMKVPELKAELTKAGLPTTGNKADLLARLLAHLETQATPTTSAPASSAPASAATAATSPAPNATAAPAAVVPETSKPAAAPAKPIDPTGKTDEELRRARAARFGIPINEVVKPAKASAAKASTKPAKAETAKAPAAEKAATTTASKPLPQKLHVNIDPETLKKRQEKFGVVSTTTTAVKAAVATAPVAALSSEDQEKKRKRDEEEEARRKKRAERFGVNASSTVRTPRFSRPRCPNQVVNR